MERLPGGTSTSDRPRSAHRPPKAGRGRLAVVAVGSGAGLIGLGIAFGVGALPMPLLSASTSNVPKTAILASVPPSADQSLSQVSASPFGYSIAKMPANLAPHHKASPKPTPSKTATPTPRPITRTRTITSSQSTTSSSGLTPQATAEYQTPTGENQLAWSEAILTALGDPLTSANIVSMGYWMQNEAGKAPYGIVGANNPINVSEPGYGGTQIQYEAPGYYLMSYPSVSEGVAAIATYLNSGSYPDILNDLKQGVGLSDSSLASELQEYSGNGYSMIPDSWGQSQGTPLS